jgi:hypothetical protein
MLFCKLTAQDGVNRASLNEKPEGINYIFRDLFKGPSYYAKFYLKLEKLAEEALKINWEKISPAIFGDALHRVMDKKQRRETGIHYAYEENILKLINPLFMDELRNEVEKLKTSPGAPEGF